MHLPTNIHADYLRLALQAAEEFAGLTAPNPAVGAVLVKEGEVLAVGAHQRAGTAHAEVNALTIAGDARGAIAYVTLEPCCHQGKTPPCTHALIAAGVSQVFYGLADPNPQVTGKGQAQLQAAGILCTHLPLAEINEFYRHYAYFHQHGLPWVTVKLALSLDGKIAAARGQPVTLSGAAVNHFTHLQRKRHHCLLTTITTVQNDDPALNVRLGAEPPLLKPVFILDPWLQFSPQQQLAATAQKIILLHQKGVSPTKEQQQFECIEVQGEGGQLDLSEVLVAIAKAGFHSVWVEVGGRCLQSFLKQNLAQQGYFYICPKLLGDDATPGFPQASFSDLGLPSWHILGEDVVANFQWYNAKN